MKKRYRVLAVALIIIEIAIGYTISVQYVVQPTENKYLKTIDAKRIFSDN